MTGLDLGGEYILARQELFDYDSGSLNVSFFKQINKCATITDEFLLDLTKVGVKGYKKAHFPFRI